MRTGDGAYAALGPLRNVRHEDELVCARAQLSLKPGYAVGNCHARRLPSVHGADCLNLKLTEWNRKCSEAE